MSLKKTVLTLIVLMAMGFAFSNLYAADYTEGRRLMPKRPGHSLSPLPCGKCHMQEAEYNHLRPKIPRVNDVLFLDECGACHLAYQPELLPKASWKKIMSNLKNHFGDDVELTPKKHYALSRFIYKKSADHFKLKPGQKAKVNKNPYYKRGGEQPYRSKMILASLKGATPIRVTEVPYIKEVHKGVNKDIFKRMTIKSFANCEACHLSADGGLYYKPHIHIPPAK